MPRACGRLLGDSTWAAAISAAAGRLDAHRARQARGVRAPGGAPVGPL